MIGKIFILCFVVLVALSCERSVQSKAEIIPLARWQHPVTLSIENQDTTSIRDIVIFIKSRVSCMECSLPVSISVIDPDSLYFLERHTLVLDDSNYVLGSCCETPYRRSCLLAKKGTYRFVIKPEGSYEGIEAVGVKLK
ncbi:MAG: hypothetical protein KBS95_03960 [Alistipes sp.]|nr:hypothetical protein [Candidatus Alistipes equi]